MNEKFVRFASININLFNTYNIMKYFKWFLDVLKWNNDVSNENDFSNAHYKNFYQIIVPAFFVILAILLVICYFWEETLLEEIISYIVGSFVWFFWMMYLYIKSDCAVLNETESTFTRRRRIFPNEEIYISSIKSLDLDRKNCKLTVFYKKWEVIRKFIFSFPNAIELWKLIEGLRKKYPK